MAATVVAATQVSAITVDVQYVTGYHAGAGGEFNIASPTGVGYSPLDLYNNNDGKLGFGTFCVDRNTDITVPGQYNATINANGITSSGNQISLGTAWLFQQFAHGTLAGYNYTPGFSGNPAAPLRADCAINLQAAIWVLEGTYSYPDPSVNPFLVAVKNFFGSIAAASADNNGTYAVGVLLLTDLRTGANVQPMLTLLPDGGSALIMLGMALSSLAVFSRKFRK